MSTAYYLLSKVRVRRPVGIEHHMADFLEAPAPACFAPASMGHGYQTGEVIWVHLLPSEVDPASSELARALATQFCCRLYLVEDGEQCTATVVGLNLVQEQMAVA